MSPIAAALTGMGSLVADLSERLGRRVDVASLGITDREGLLELAEPGIWSPNRACRLVQTADGWIAVNLAREEDRELVPAWLLAPIGSDPWEAIVEISRRRATRTLMEQAILLGLPVSEVGEVAADAMPAPVWRLGEPGPPGLPHPLRALDLSALWAGPMCGAILAAMGAEVLKIESPSRPDPTRASSPEFFRRLNGQKEFLELPLGSPPGRRELLRLIAEANVLITSARPRALRSLDLTVETIFAARPALTWVAITGYGWGEASAMRVAFGDDAAAAGGLVGWTSAAEPRFLGDALSDPVTGLGAAAVALRGLIEGGGQLISVAMASAAAAAAATSGITGMA